MQVVVEAVYEDGILQGESVEKKGDLKLGS